MAAHGCVLVAEHTSEMVGSTRNNDDFDYDHYFDYDDEFDYYDDCAYYDDCCAAHGDNNNCCAEQQLWQQRHDDDYDIDDYDNYHTNIANPNCDMVTNNCPYHRTITEHTVGCDIFW